METSRYSRGNLRIFTAGTFDLLHLGHLDLFEFCSLLGNVTVSVNTDEFVEEFKGSRPIINTEDRVEMVKKCKYVDEVLINWSGSDLKPTIYRASPDIIVIGSDWLERDYLKQIDVTPDWLVDHEISLLYMPRYRPMSSSDIKKKINSL